MNRRRGLSLILAAVFFGTVVADARCRASPRCCDQPPAWAFGVESGVIFAKTDEMVEARPEYTADYLSNLTWKTRAALAGIHLGYRAGEILRMNGKLWYLTNTWEGTLVNLDYLDSTSDTVTHRSVSPSSLVGVGWELSTDFMLLDEAMDGVFVRSFARLGYRGNYHSWKARGGDYDYPGSQGEFDDNEDLIRYLVLHQVFVFGAFAELGQNDDGLYGRLGGAVSPLSWVRDRDTHVVSATDYYNTYREGWYVRPEIAAGMRFGTEFATEVFYEPELQFEFAVTRTLVKTPHGVHHAAESPNYKMTLHRVGVRLVWSVLSV